MDTAKPSDAHAANPHLSQDPSAIDDGSGSAEACQPRPKAKAEPKPHFNLSRWSLQNSALTRYLMIVLLLLGVAAFFQLGQDEDPPFTFRVMVVQAMWPGATAEQVAEQVTDKIERTLQEVPGADKIRSFAKPGESTTIFQLKDNLRPGDVPGAWYQVRKKIGDMRHTLPQGVRGPFFNDEFGDVYGVIFGLEAEGYSPAEMKDFADEVRQRLLHVPDVAKVSLFGVQDQKVFVEVSQKRLSQLGLDMNSVLAQMNQQNAVESAGAVQTPLDVVQVRVQGQFNAVDDLRAMPIRASDGRQLRLGDIATVTRGYVDPPAIKVRHQGQEVVALGVAMAKGGDVIRMGKALRLAVADIQKTLPAGVKLTQIQDQPKAVADSVNEFLQVLIEAVVVVVGVSFLALGLHKKPGTQGPIWRRYILDWRPGLVVAITIPVVLSVTFLAMYFFNIGLHKVSLGSLIIALGLLVDDAIIAVEMMVRKLEEGYDKLRAATFAYEITAMPMLTGTLITAAGFLPIGIAKSTTGEYTFAIFAVTAVALVISWFASVIFVPLLGTWLLKPPAHTAVHSEDEHELFDTPFYNRFRRWVDWCVRHRWLTIGATVLSFVLGMFGMTQVQQQFFPDSARPEVMVDLWFPEGTSFAANEAVTKRFEARMMKEPGVVSVTEWVGSGTPRFYLPLDQVFPQPNVAQFIVLPKDLKERERIRKALPAVMAAEFPEVRGRVKLLPNGPPVAYPVQFRVMGGDPVHLKQKAAEVAAIMRANPDALGVNDNWNEKVKAIRLQVDQEKARALGVSTQSISQMANIMLSGAAVGQYREGDKTIDIVLRQPLDERQAMTDLGNAYLPTASGKPIPLLQIARPVLDWEWGVMWRDGRDYSVTVQSDIREGLQGATVTNALWPKLNALQQQWHAKGDTGYRIEVAGAVEESAKGSSSIVTGVPIMLFVVFTLLMLQLHSFSRALLVFITGPLGIAGVAAALLLLDRPFGFVALLGFIALLGMIQRNAVILVDQIETDRARGATDHDAIVEAAVRRLRPIALTAAAAVLAMIPLSRSTFWGPMAVAIMGGLIVATVLTLFALPAMYAAWFRVKHDPRDHSGVAPA